MAATVGVPTRERTTGKVLSIILILVMALATFMTLSSIQLQEQWISAITEPFSARRVISEESSTQDNHGNRIERYHQLYQYHPPQARTESVPVESCGNGTDFTDYFLQSMKTRSANNEDRDIYSLSSVVFQEIGQEGTYIELGGFDGIQESNTRFFDVCLGWNGLLIEANPTMYPKLTKNRPNAHRMSFAPSCSVEDEAENKTLPFHDYPWTNAGLAGHANAYKEKRVVDVPCGSLSPVIKDIFDGHVDFFSLDVEGAEALVVGNIDFAEVVVELLMVENRNNFCGPQCDSRDRVRTRMQEVGYTRHSNVIQKSDLYIHPNSRYKLPEGYSTVNVPSYIAE